MVVTLSVAGSMSYTEGDGMRQYVNCTFYDRSAGATHADDLDWWDQEPGPSCSAAFNWIAAEDVAIPNANTGQIDFDDECSHPYMDALSYALTTGTWPTGISLAAGVANGTPTTEDEDGIALVVTATSDETGATATQSLTAYVWNTLTLLVNCVDGVTTPEVCTEAIESQFLHEVTTYNPNGSISVAETYDCLFVQSQDPELNAELAVFGAATLNSSACGIAGVMGSKGKVGIRGPRIGL
jgi:hypothetical protein